LHALIELPKYEAVIANVAIVKKRGESRIKIAKDLRDKMIKKAREEFAKQMAAIKPSIKLEMKRAADEASVALTSAKRLREIVYAPEAYDSRTKLTDVLWILAKNGYAQEADECAGLNRETWTYLPPEMSEEDKDRVRKTNMFWQSIINLEHGKWKVTRLARAASEGKLSRVRELCDWSAGIEKADKDGRTPLYYASLNGELDVVLELLNRGANIEAETDYRATSLFIASQQGYLHVVRELLARGANVEAANIRGDTPLMFASFYGRAEIVLALLNAGANKHHVDKDGDTAVSLAGLADGVKRSAKAAVLALLA